MNNLRQFLSACILLVALSVCALGQGEKIIHFPSDCSLGWVEIRDANASTDVKTFHFWIEWQRLCDARGDVLIPAGKVAKLVVYTKNLNHIKKLNELDVNDLHSLILYGSLDQKKMPTDRCMEYISHLSGLKELNINSDLITSRGLFKIRNLQQLERLWLGKGISNAGMRIVGQFKSLKGLYLHGSRINNTGLEKICQTLSLEQLVISDGKIDDTGLKYLTGMGTLKYLGLGGDNITDAAMEQVSNIPSLKILHLGHVLKITDAGVKHISEHPGLERINFHWNKNITNQGAKYLSTMLTLKMLDIRHSKIDDTGVGHLSRCKTLELLELPRTGITDVGLKHLSTISGLKDISIPRSHYIDPKLDVNHYTNEGLKHISKLIELERLQIGGLGVSDTGMEHIAKLHKLKYLMLFGCPITDDGLNKLTGLKSLETIYFYETKLTIAGMKNLNVLTNLKDVTIQPVQQDDSVMDISGLSKLQRLRISTPRKSDKTFKDADMTCLSKLKQLENLSISPSSEIGDKGLGHLSELANLDSLCIGGPNLTDDGLRHLQRMKKLSRLYLHGPKLTNKALKHLERLKAMTALTIVNNHNITKNSLVKLSMKLPIIERINMPKPEKKRK